MGFEDENDLRVLKEEIIFLIDKDLKEIINEIEIDYKEEGLREGFIITGYLN